MDISNRQPFAVFARHRAFIKTYTYNHTEQQQLLRLAAMHLQQAKRNNAKNSVFTLSYSSARHLALAALRFQGYSTRSDYLAFSYLGVTANIADEDRRLFLRCYHHRSVALYEHHLDVGDELTRALLDKTKELMETVREISSRQKI